MDQKPTPRDPHGDNALIDDIVSEPGATGGSAGGRLATDIGSRDEERSAAGADPELTRATKGDKVQPRIPTRADNEDQNI